MPTLTINDETIAGATIPALELEFPDGTITLRELISSRVEEEVRRHNAKNNNDTATVVFNGLVQPNDSERLMNGYRMRKRRLIDADVQVEKAFEAFERNGFFVLIDDRQVDDLDAAIEIGLKTQVSFVKLLPLVGG